MVKSSQLEKDRLYEIRHSAAHVMAQAVLELYPQARLGIGPPTETGFYYDFDLGPGDDGKPRTFTPEDLEAIEKGMRRIIGGRFPFDQRVVSAEEAKELLADQPYKVELIEGLERGEVDENGDEVEAPPEITTYRQDSFEDLCAGPHVEHTGKIPVDAFKLMSVAGAYWRGDEANPMMQRIYGTAWKNKKELRRHLDLLEEAKKRDHRKIGKDLEIFTFDDEIGPGLPLWLPNGGILIDELERLAKDLEFKAGYERVRTPHLSKETLFLKSGHLPYYQDSMYPPMEMDGADYYIKPMNCPFHHKIYASRPRSYRELPLRLAEYGTCYRYEKSGELFGLMRVRSLQMNDAHIYCAEDQFEAEFMAVIDMYLEYFRLFAVDSYFMRLSTHHKKGLGKKYVDNERLWLKTEDMVRQAMEKGGIPFVEVADEAAFYGPKIDVQIESVIGKEFTLATNQVDFAQPDRFELRFVTAEGAEATPLCIHRAPLSTHERLVGFLIEHFGGAFPPWLAPQQVRLVPISDTHNDYAQRVVSQLREAGIRADADLASERMNAKIRKAQLLKIPYMLVVGDREMEEGTVAVRKRDGSRQNAVPVEEFRTDLAARIARRESDL
ncbi:MAG: threonine--tRNA ligase [Acidobacteriota bacterium]